MRWLAAVFPFSFLPYLAVNLLQDDGPPKMRIMDIPPYLLPFPHHSPLCLLLILLPITLVPQQFAGEGYRLRREPTSHE